MIAPGIDPRCCLSHCCEVHVIVADLKMVNQQHCFVSLRYFRASGIVNDAVISDVFLWLERFSKPGFPEIGFCPTVSRISTLSVDGLTFVHLVRSATVSTRQRTLRARQRHAPTDVYLIPVVPVPAQSH